MENSLGFASFRNVFGFYVRFPLQVTTSRAVDNRISQSAFLETEARVVSGSIEQFQQLFDVNLFGAARVNRAVLLSMRRQRRGLLIHVSSAAGRLTAPCMAVYCGTKFALEALADAYRFELSPFGIDSVLVEPGIHRTPILERFITPDDQARVADYGSEYVARIRNVFDTANQSPQTPGTDEAVETFVRLIEMPNGQRPFRTVPTAALQPLLEPYNAAAADVRQVVAQIFNVPELLVLQKHA
jgi:NAD(P)-dependent dehydrogenase (short-subunit alcohol dehydrogenase family)